MGKYKYLSVEPIDNRMEMMMQYRRKHLWWYLAISFLIAMCAWSGSAWAVVEGQKPQTLKTFKIFGSAEVTGNTMMAASPPGNVNDILLPQNSASIRGVPYDGKLVAAYVWWTGSTDVTGIDREVDFMLPNGAKSTLQADTCLTVSSFGGFFYCRKEITSFVQQQGSGVYNGNYTLSNLQALVGRCPPAGNDTWCQARYAAWSMILVWESPTHPVRRDIVVYDGFLHMDEQPTSSGITNFDLTGFRVGDPPEGSFTYFGLEGDSFLGHPPEPPEYSDFISFRSSSSSQHTRLSSATPYNPPGNIWNSTIALGVDIDTFNIGRSGLNLLRPGDTSVNIICGTGDGIVPDGDGESVFLGFILMVLDTLSPNFRNSNTVKRVDKLTASEGDILTYTLRVTNSGSLAANNVIITDTIPPFTSYVLGSTQVDGRAIPDVGGTTPLVQGLNLGTIDFRGKNDRDIIFQVRITGTPPTQRIENSFVVRSDEVEPTRSNVVVTTLRAPQMGTVSKKVTNQTNPNGPARPGDTLVYEVLFNNAGGTTITGVQFIDDLPKYVKWISLTPPLGTAPSDNLSNPTGGANGTGRVEIRNITVPSNAARLILTVRVFNEAEFIAAGVTIDKIDGTLLSNHGEARHASLPGGSVRTDDPDTPARNDPTVVRVSYRADFVGSSKAVVDDNGGRPEPGDTLTYTITLTNRGTRDTTVRFEDSMPPSVGNYRQVSIPANSTANFQAAPAGGNQTGLLTVSKIELKVGQTQTIVFKVDIRADVPNNQPITNIGTIIDEKVPGLTLTISSPTLVVVAGPLLDTSTKTVANQSGQPVAIVSPGMILRYTITVRNTGNRNAVDVEVRDQMPSELDQIAVQGGRLVGTEAIWDKTQTPALASIASGASVALTFTARVKLNTPDGTLIRNQGILRTPSISQVIPTDDPTTPAKGDPTVVRVAAKPNLAVTKIVQDTNGPPAEPGDRLTYTIVIRNTGTGVAEDIVVSDPIDPSLVNVSTPNGRLTAGAIIWDKTTEPKLASLGIGEQITLTFQAQILTPLANGTVISNQASVRAKDLAAVLSDDPNTPAPNDPTRITVQSTANPILHKTVTDLNGGDVVPGDVLLYTISIRAQGTSPLVDVVVTDPVPTQLENITAPRGRVSGSIITWDKTTEPALANINPGQVVNLTFTARVRIGLADGTVIANQGQVRATGFGPQPTDNPSTPAPNDPTVVTVRSRSDLSSSTKTVVDVNGGLVVPGDLLSYTITIRNTGNMNATNVVITDPIDSNLTNIQALDAGIFSNNQITWRLLQPILPGTAVQVRFNATVKSPLPNGTVIPNQAKITASGGLEVLSDDPNTPAPNDPTKVVVTSGPSFTETTKTVTDQNGGNVEPGDVLLYTIIVRNTGTDVATNVTVRDKIDTTKINQIRPGQGGVYLNDEIVWNASTTPALSSIPVGGSVTLSFTATVLLNVANGAVISNQAFVTNPAVTTPVPSDDPRTVEIDDPTKVTVVTGASLQGSTKTVRDNNGGTVQPGDTLTYTIVVRNTGTSVARDVVVIDHIDTQRLVNVQPQAGIFDGTVIRWNSSTNPALAAIAPNQSVNLTYTAEVAPTLPAGTRISNQGQISAAGLPTPALTDDPTTPALYDPTVVIIGGQPNISATKTVVDVNGGTAEPGDTLAYTIVVTNTGTATATNVIVSDTLDPSLEAIALAPGNNGVYDAANHRIVWQIGNLVPNARVTLAFRANIKQNVPNGTVIPNQALISSADISQPVLSDNPNTPAPNDSTDVVVQSPMFIIFTKTARNLNGGNYRPGHIVEYTITVQNGGRTPIAGVVVTDRIDPNLDQVVPSQGGSFANGEIRWDSNNSPVLRNPITAGQSVVISFRARILPSTANGTRIPNQATMTTAGFPAPLLSDDPNTPAPTDPTVILVAFPDLSGLTKQAIDLNGGSFEPGDIIEYRINVRNGGQAALTNIVVTDPVDTTWLEDIRPVQGNLVGNTITWDRSTNPNLAQIAPNQFVLLVFFARIKSNTPNGTVIANQAFARSDEVTTPEPSDDPNTPAPKDPTRIEVRSAPNLSQVSKTVQDNNGGLVLPGDTLTYTISITNTGSRPANNVTVTDPIDIRLTNINVTNGNFDPATRLITWNSQTEPQLRTIPSGGTVTLRFTAVVDIQTPNGTVISNQAAVNSPDISAPEFSDDPTTPNPKDPTRVTVQATAILDATKSVQDINGGEVLPGDILEYTISVRNRGSVAASQVRLTDATPANTEYITGSLRLNGVVITDGGTNPLIQGITVNSARPGTPEGSIIPDNGAPPHDEVATITFRVRIRQNTPVGTRIRNIAVVRAQDIDPVNSNPADVIVGGGPDLAHTAKTVSIAEDRQTPGVADIDDVLVYTVTIRNTGRAAATNVVFRDPIPNNSVYSPNTIRLNWQILTDAADGDAGEFQPNVGPNGTVLVRLGTLDPGAVAVILFRVRITGGTEISNQGFVSSDNFPTEPTDADDDDSNGNQPTVIPVGQRESLTASKSVFDLNGGDVNPGDILEYRISLTNSGQVTLANISVRDIIPTNTNYQPNSAQGQGNITYDAPSRTLTFSDISLDPGASALLLFRVQIDSSVANNTKITNKANVSALPQIQPFDTNTVEVTVKHGGIESSITGLVFQDIGPDDTKYDPSQDLLLPGFKIKLFAENNLTDVAAETVVDAQGRYRIEQIQPNKYKLRFYSERDIQFGEYDIDLTQGGEFTRNIVVQPTGRIYNSQSGALLPDARIYLVYDDLSATPCTDDKDCTSNSLCVRDRVEDSDGRCGEKIPDNLMFENQQGQVTNPHGMYKFSLASSERRFRIVVKPADEASVFPSSRIPPQSGVARYEDFSDAGKVVAHAQPDASDPNKSTNYYVRFSVTQANQILRNNHLPIDLAGSLIILTKRASAQSVTIGDIITYTLELKNNSGISLNYDLARNVGGVYFTDIMPDGFRMLPLSPRLNDQNGRVILAKVTPGSRNNQNVQPQRIFRFGPFDLPARSTLTLRYQVVIARQLPVGQYINIAYVHNSAGGRITEDARAMVRVVYDPIFDQGTVIGKVFCDRNKDRRQDPEDEGVAGVRLYLDNGHYVNTDEFGKYHFQAIDPGNHLIKIDLQSLPPGATMIDNPDEVFYVSRGLLRKINFAISCPENNVGVQKLLLHKPKPKTIKLKIDGSVHGPRLNIDDKHRALPVVDLAIGDSTQIPNFEQQHGPDLRLKGRRQLTQPVVFFMRTAPGFTAKEWQLDIYLKADKDNPLNDKPTPGNGTPAPDKDKEMRLLLRSFKGTDQTHPPRLTWDGRSVAGNFLLAPRQTYMARLTIKTADGTISQSAWRVFGVEVTRTPPSVVWERTFSADIMGAQGVQVRGRAAFTLRKHLAEITAALQRPRAELQIEVHHDNSMPRARALFFTVRRASALQNYFQALLKHISPKIDAKGLGSAHPQLPNINNRNRQQNRRIIVRVIVPASETKPQIPPLSFNPYVQLGDKQLDLDQRGLFSTTIETLPTAAPRLKIQTPFGAYLDLPLIELKQPDTSATQPKATPKAPQPISRTTRPTQIYPDISPARVLQHKRQMIFEFEDISQSITLHNRTARPSFRLFLASSPHKTAPTRAPARSVAPHTQLRSPTSTTDPNGSEPPLPNLSGTKPSEKDSKPATTAPSDEKFPIPDIFNTPNDSKPTDRSKPMPKPDERKAAPPAKTAQPSNIKAPPPPEEMVSVPLEQAKDVKAAQLRISLPPNGSVIYTAELPVNGVTHPTNILTIDGQRVTLNKDGTFKAVVKLKHGQKQLAIRTQDTDNNRGEIDWPVHVNLNRFFLMAFADTAIAQDSAAQLQGFSDHSSFRAAGMIFHGRAVLYTKGQIQGKHFLDRIFNEIRFTAHFDSAKKAELESFYKQLIDPNKFYPIYGDSSQQVQDVTARNKVYILIEADRSKLLVGNFRTQMQGFELVRYDRTFYGFDIDFQKRFAKHFDTRARFFISDGSQQQLKAHLQMRATAGSLYYLKHQSISEGSEQVRISIRDKDSGIVLAQIPLQRDQDYSIQYFEGRLFFKYPVPSVVDSFILTQHNLNTTLNGNPVFIEIDYEYETIDGQGGLALGVRAEQSFTDHARIGFSFVHEGRADATDPYQLWGFDLALRLNPNTYLQAEYARSSSFDSASYLSSDGGLSFSPIQHFYSNLSLDRQTPFRRASIGGNAVAVRAASDIGELFKWKKFGIQVRSYFTWREQGFFASGQELEQGSIKGGVLTHLTLFDKHKLMLKYDGYRSQQFDLITSRYHELEQHILNIQYVFNFLPEWDVVIEYSHTNAYDQKFENMPGNQPLTFSNFVTLGANWRVSKIFHVLLRQQLAFATVSREPLTVMDHFATSLGLNLRVFDNTFLSATGTVRWSGNVGAQIGLKTQLNPTAQVYIREQINYTQLGTGLVHTFVLGAEHQLTQNSRVYGEYQLDGGISAESNRAVMGLSHVFHLFEGMMLGAGLEYAKFLDPAMGNTSRTVGRVSVQYTALRNFKASGRYELRYDDADPRSTMTGDRIQFVTTNNLAWQITNDLSFFSNFNYALTHNYFLNQNAGGSEAELLELNVGFAMRPVRYDWLNLLFKYTMRKELRPYLLNDNRNERSTSEVISLATIFELPLRLEIVEQFAVKFRQEQVDGLQPASTATILWINRINFKLIKNFGLGVEYRFLWMWMGSAGEAFALATFDHGFLLEATYNVHRFVHIGLGYNFSRFSDDLFAEPHRDYSGFFLRVVGKY